ncbi:hypothetical protein [Flagellimonas algicola]|uniref:Uncharacterized protein n=1 Tax=Flagellimonas algicola TaxID=2583815 RepID=A0ABY2WL02_9FLAO|nr:hypothetical protein [Allomuricauda algicola]TMU55099.1 hypothetical protein FGG15_13015 [Allomuricauda algicola]
MKSNFEDDLAKERLLSQFLDIQYQKHLRRYFFKRISDTEAQLQGIDLVFTHKQTGLLYHIDEKAQLDYPNENLPTFAFELCYEKDGEPKTGWFLDATKKTDFYSLITGIYADEKDKFTACNITFVNREKLLDFLASWKLTKEKMEQLALSQPDYHGKMELNMLNPQTEGYLFFSRKNKVEEPVNLILKLEFLIRIGVGKRLV